MHIVCSTWNRVKLRACTASQWAVDRSFVFLSRDDKEFGRYCFYVEWRRQSCSQLFSQWSNTKSMRSKVLCITSCKKINFQLTLHERWCIHLLIQHNTNLWYLHRLLYKSETVLIFKKIVPLQKNNIIIYICCVKIISLYFP